LYAASRRQGASTPSGISLGSASSKAASGKLPSPGYKRSVRASARIADSTIRDYVGTTELMYLTEPNAGPNILQYEGPLV
jgi:hypothetical protein